MSPQGQTRCRSDSWIFENNANSGSLSVSIAIPENNAKNSAPQSVNYCVTDFRRTPVRLQICSLQFALCSTAFFALFSGLAIGFRSDKSCDR